MTNSLPSFFPLVNFSLMPHFHSTRELSSCFLPCTIQQRVNSLSQSIINNDLSLSDQDIQLEIRQLRCDLANTKPAGFQKLCSELEKMEDNLILYRFSVIKYYDIVAQIDKVTNSLRASFLGPLSGFSTEAVDEIKKAFSLLTKLSSLACQIDIKAGTIASEAFSELVEVEINHIAWQLEDWQQAIQERQLYHIANQEYKKDPSKLNAIRLEILFQEADKLQKSLPVLQNEWEILINRFNIKEDHSDVFPEVLAHVNTIYKNASYFRATTTCAFSENKELYFCDFPDPKKSWFSQVLHSLYNSDQWSKTTKDRVFRGLSLMQLTAVGTNLLRDLPKKSPSTIGEKSPVHETSSITLTSELLAAQSTLIALAPEKATEISPQIQTLREEIRAFSRALQQAVIIPAALTCERLDVWEEEEEATCFSLEKLEKNAARLLAETREEIDSHVLLASESALSAYGNKHKNIIKQARLALALDLPGIEVPVPQGVSTDEVYSHLKISSPQVFQSWETLQTLYQGDSSFLQKEEIQQLLKTIDRGIQEAFKTFSLSKNMKCWLEKMEKQGSYLMVRSTGAEDSRKSANAGGNDSVSYVRAREKELLEALAKVVRSYFGTRSLQNRINANLNPFSEELSLAVTVQELIGESPGKSSMPGDIPISIVVFTNEPLYVGEEKFRVTRLSATYGHGEGVVGNQGIASDTILVLHSVSQPDLLYILYNNHEKPERLAPVIDPNTKEVHLQKIPNPSSLATKSALSGEQIARIFQWGILVESYFQDAATDLEIVIKGNIIYPLQARPVNRGGLLPTYLDQKKITETNKKPILDTIHSEILVSGKASVIGFSDPEAILIAETLEQAEREFQKGKHNLVIVYQDEPANSHPIVNFSSLSVPCLYMPNKEEMEALMKKTKPIVVCMQTGEIHLWDETQGNVSDYTSEGFVIHPAKVAVSLPILDSLPKDSGYLGKTPQEVKELVRRIRAASTQEVGLANLKKLRQHLWLQNFQQTTQNLQGSFQREVKPVAKAAAALEQSVEKAFAELEALLTNPLSGRLETLLRVKVLETLLFTSPFSGSSLGQYSVVSIQSNFAAALELIKYQKQLAHTAYFTDILLAGSESPNDVVFKKWRDFLLSLEPLAEKLEISSEQILSLKEFIYIMQQANILPVYLTFFFAPTLNNPKEDLKNLLASFHERDKGLIFELLKETKEVQQLDLTCFENLGTFETAFQSLKDRQERLFDPNTFQGLLLARENWNQASPPIRFIALEMLRNFINTYDLAIKTMKASRHFSQTQKVHLLKKMLDPYLSLLKEMKRRLLPLDIFKDHVTEYSIEGQVDKIEAILEGLSETDPQQLYPSKAFSVSAAAFGSGAYFDSHRPRCLEDVFTLIHQDLLVINEWLLNQMISQDNIAQAVPEKMNNVLSNIKSMNNDQMRKPNLIKMQVTSTKISLQYTVPLRSHSSFLTIIYDKKTDNVEIQAQFFGVSEQSRWEKTKNAVEFLSQIGSFPLSKPIFQNSQEIRIVWNCDKNSKDILNFYSLLAQKFFRNYDISFPPLEKFFESKVSAYLVSNVVLTLLSAFSEKPLLPIELWNILLREIEREKKYQQVIQIAMEWFQKKDPGYRENALRLFEMLIEKGQGYSEAIEAAKQMALDDAVSARRLFEGLIVEGQGYSEAIEAAKQMALDDAVSAIWLFEALIVEGQGYSEAIEVAKQMALDHPVLARRLFEGLIVVGQAFEEAMDAVAKIIMQDYFAGESLLNKLIEKKGNISKINGYKQAIGTAKQLMDTINYYRGIKLFKVFFKKGLGYQDAIDAAEQLMRTAPEKGLQLFDLLFEYKKGYKEANIMVGKLMLENPFRALQLWWMLRNIETGVLNNQ